MHATQGSLGVSIDRVQVALAGRILIHPNHAEQILLTGWEQVARTGVQRARCHGPQVPSANLPGGRHKGPRQILRSPGANACGLKDPRDPRNPVNDEYDPSGCNRECLTNILRRTPCIPR